MKKLQFAPTTFGTAYDGSYNINNLALYDYSATPLEFTLLNTITQYTKLEYIITAPEKLAGVTFTITASKFYPNSASGSTTYGIQNIWSTSAGVQPLSYFSGLNSANSFEEYAITIEFSKDVMLSSITFSSEWTGYPNRAGTDWVVKTDDSWLELANSVTPPIPLVPYIEFDENGIPKKGSIGGGYVMKTNTPLKYYIRGYYNDPKDNVNVG